MKYCPQCRESLATKTDSEGHERLYCPDQSCGFVFWNNPTPVVAVIIETQGKVMLVHQVGWPPKMLGLVSGFLEAGEHPDRAIEREIKEETSLELEALSFIGHYAFEMQNQLIIAYAAKCSGEIQLNHELDRYKLIEKDKLVPWELGTGPAVRDWLASQQDFQL